MTETVQSATPSVADVLNYAADLVAQPGAWMQLNYARTAEGITVQASDPSAACFCAVGAVIAARTRLDAPVVTDMVVIHARRAAQPGVDDEHLLALSEWNDELGRTQQEVVDLLRKAAETVQ